MRSINPQPQTHSCELGDILFLVAYDRPNTAHRIGLGNASLVQAKLGYEGAKGAQSVLYQSTEEFSYTSPASLSPQQRSLRNAQNCLWYWSLHDGPWHNETSFELARPSGVWGGWEESLGRFLLDLFCGVSGRGVRRLPNGNGWSQIVHDLLNDTAHRLVNRKGVIINGSRFSSAGSALAALSSQRTLRFFIGDASALYSSIGYPIELPEINAEELGAAESGLPPRDRRPLDRGEEGQGDSITTARRLGN